MLDVNAWLDEANVENNVVTRTVTRVFYYAAFIPCYAFITVKRFFVR